MNQDEVIARIYEAALLPELWPELLDALARRVGALGGTLGWPGESERSLIFSAGISDMVNGWMDRGFDREGQRHAPLRRQQGGFVTDFDLHSERRRRVMPCYRDYLVPLGFELGAATLITGADRGDTLLTIEGFPAPEAMRAAVPLLDVLRPHLVHAFALATKAGLGWARALVEGFDQAGSAAAVLDAGGRLLAANARFGTTMEPFARAARRQLRFVNREADAAFTTGLQAATRNARASTIPLRDSAGSGHVVMHLRPAGSAADHLIGTTALAMLAHPGRHAVPPAGILQTLFDLTPAESEVARAIAGGASVERAAQNSGKSVETVRSHLKRAFSKTGTARQSELSLLLMGFAAPFT